MSMMQVGYCHARRSDGRIVVFRVMAFQVKLQVMFPGRVVADFPCYGGRCDPVTDPCGRSAQPSRTSRFSRPQSKRGGFLLSSFEAA